MSIFSDLNWILVVVLAVLGCFTYSGYRRGFVKLIISLLSMALTFYLVWLITPHITDFLMENTTAYESIVDSLNESFREANSVRDNTIYENQLQTIDSYSVPTSMKELLVENNKEDVYRSLMVNIFEEYVSAFLGKLIIRVIAFISTFILIMLFLKMTFLSMELISKIPVISGINRLFGLIFGFVEGIFIVWIGYIFAILSFGKKFYAIVSTSRILLSLYNSNPVLDFIGKGII